MVEFDIYDEKRNRAAQRVLDSLDKLDARMDAHFAKTRQHARHNFRGRVVVCIPDPDEPIVRPDDDNAFPAWGRSLSESGMSFIHVAPIDVPLVLVGIELAGQPRKWFQAEIVRRRSYENEGFHEFGVVFRGRA